MAVGLIPPGGGQALRAAPADQAVRLPPPLEPMRRPKTAAQGRGVLHADGLGLGKENGRTRLRGTIETRLLRDFRVAQILVKDGGAALLCQLHHGLPRALNGKIHGGTNFGFAGVVAGADAGLGDCALAQAVAQTVQHRVVPTGCGMGQKTVLALLHDLSPLHRQAHGIKAKAHVEVLGLLREQAQQQPRVEGRAVKAQAEVPARAIHAVERDLRRPHPLPGPLHHGQDHGHEIHERLLDGRCRAYGFVEELARCIRRRGQQRINGVRAAAQGPVQGFQQAVRRCPLGQGLFLVEFVGEALAQRLPVKLQDIADLAQTQTVQRFNGRVGQVQGRHGQGPQRRQCFTRRDTQNRFFGTARQAPGRQRGIGHGQPRRQAPGSKAVRQILQQAFLATKEMRAARDVQQETCRAPQGHGRAGRVQRHQRRVAGQPVRDPMPALFDLGLVDTHGPQPRHQSACVGQGLALHRASSPGSRVGVVNHNQVPTLNRQSPGLLALCINGVRLRPQSKARTDDGNDASHRTTPTTRMRGRPHAGGTFRRASGPGAWGEGVWVRWWWVRPQTA